MLDLTRPYDLQVDLFSLPFAGNDAQMGPSIRSSEKRVWLEGQVRLWHSTAHAAPNYTTSIDELPRASC